MDDMISRKEAISELMEWVEKEKNKSWSPFKGLFHWTGIKAMLECLPSAQPEPQWIPVKERLPDMPIRVLVQLDNGWIITAYRQDNEWLSVPDFGEAIKDKWVEAWMPLPEPYRAERRTE